MSKRKSEHWTNHGTGLTNFPPEDFDRFREAVKRFGSKRFEVSTERMIGVGEKCQGGSLHYLGEFRTEKGHDEIHRFWLVFDEIPRGFRVVEAA